MVIRHSRGSYSVNFGALSDLWGSVPSGAFIITDDRIAAHYPELLHQRPALVLPNGEHTKSIPYLGQCCEWLATQRADRKSMVVALGGGVIGDLVGFVAATYLRASSTSKSRRRFWRRWTLPLAARSLLISRRARTSWGRSIRQLKSW